MVKIATKFTPEVLLSTPRRSDGQSSHDGKHILHTIQAYSFEEHNRTRELRVLEAYKGLSHLVVKDDFTEAIWTPNNEILYLKNVLCDGKETGRTEIIQTDISGLAHTSVGIVEGSISGLKLKRLQNGDLAFLSYGRADRHGNLVNEKKVKQPAHTSMVFDKLFVRHWDTYKDRYHNSLFYGVLTLGGPFGKWRLKSFESLLAGTKLESPLGPFPSSSDYDLSDTGVIFIAKDPSLDPAIHTKSNLYYVPIPSDTLVTDFGHQSPMLVATQTIDGAASSPVFSPDGRSAAFLKMTEDGYETDRNLVIYVPDIAGACLYTSSGDCSISCPEGCNALHQAPKPIKLKGAGPATETWDISPSKLEFGHNSNSLFLLAEQEAAVHLFFCDVPTGSLEKIGFHDTIGSISNVSAFGNRARLFITGSNLVDNSVFAFVDPHNWSEPQLLSSQSKNGVAFGLHKKQVESFYYESEEGRCIHALVMKPSNFDESKKYPLAMLIHGGPQAAWLENWSTRWNPAVWAEQGYVVVMPNITGSTGYGQAHVDAIASNWGKAPYEDIVKCFEYLKANRSYVDTDRAIAAGASYGGYMMYWIQGQPLGRKFKALIAHDGVFNSIGAQMSTDELWFPFHDLNGPLWGENGRKNWTKYDPSRYTQNWDTPMLVIHNGKDYRLDIADGLAAFNVLQAKGVPSRFLTAPDENHWTLKEENSRVWHTVVLNWANKYAGLKPYREDEAAVIEPNEPFDS